MAYKVIILYQLYMPSYFLGTFTEYPYEIAKDKYCTVHFQPVRTKALRLTAQLQEGKSAGILEWKVR